MSRILVAVDLKVQCSDGCTYEGVSLTVEDKRRIYLASDGTQLEGVQCIDKCMAVLPPMALAAVLKNCEDCD